MKNKIGIALGSGGPRGLSHIGVIKALEEHKVPIDILAGTSIGALIGGLYLSIGSIHKLEEMVVHFKITDLARILSDVGLRTGIIKGERLERFLDSYIKDVKIQDLPIPFAALSTNIVTGVCHEVSKGNLTKAIRASTSLPGFLDITKLDDNYMIDGGVIQPVPIRAAHRLGADKVIAINLDQYSFATTDFQTNSPGMTKVGLAAIKLLRYSLAQEQCREAEVVIVPDVVEIAWKDLTYERDRIKIIQEGYLATIEKMDDILALLV
jgi:NTE family protein